MSPFSFLRGDDCRGLCRPGTPIVVNDWSRVSQIQLSERRQEFSVWIWSIWIRQQEQVEDHRVAKVRYFNVGNCDEFLCHIRWEVLRKRRPHVQARCWSPSYHDVSSRPVNSPNRPREGEIIVWGGELCTIHGPLIPFGTPKNHWNDRLADEYN